MRYIKIYILFITAIGLILVSCTDLQENVAQPYEVKVHGSQTFVKTSAEFHGKQLVDGKMDDCKRCHQSNFSGGITGVNCSTSNCHPTITVHTAKIFDPSSPQFHGRYLTGPSLSMNQCTQCHGTTYTGGIVSPTCSSSSCHPTISVHTTNIMNPSSPQFHGKYFASNNAKMSQCTQCHGTTYSGGIESPTCANCHQSINVHTTNIMNPSSPQFHGKYIAGKNWNFDQCRQCHGQSYNGGNASPTCNTCHNKPNGPEACNTCHGDFNDINKTAPPQSLNNDVATSNPSVGAHGKHLYEHTYSSTTTCSECHSVPTALNSAGHIDSSPKAEIKFGTLATGAGTPSYNFSDYKCSNTYCHGNFEFSKSTSQYQFAYTAEKMLGNNYKPTWNKVDGSQSACGTCHGLPPTGHMDASISACATCHQGVIDQTGKIIDKTKHINGKINVFGN